MKKIFAIVGFLVTTIFVGGVLLLGGRTESVDAAAANLESGVQGRNIATEREFDVAVLVDWRPLDEYAARGRRYV